MAEEGGWNVLGEEPRNDSFNATSSLVIDRESRTLDSTSMRKE